MPARGRGDEEGVWRACGDAMQQLRCSQSRAHGAQQCPLTGERVAGGERLCVSRGQHCGLPKESPRHQAVARAADRHESQQSCQGVAAGRLRIHLKQ